jgi:hypothetical protein
MAAALARPAPIEGVVEQLADADALIVFARPSASRLRLVMAAMRDPAVRLNEAQRLTYGPDGSMKLARDLYYVLRAFDAAAEARSGGDR